MREAAELNGAVQGRMARGGCQGITLPLATKARGFLTRGAGS